VPSVFGRSEIIDTGGLVHYGTDLANSDRRIACHVDKILKRANPRIFRVEQPKKFEFFINLIAAKQIGLPIPPNVLARADRVIK
jgi:putative ABC transport system substrate-binding protein